MNGALPQGISLSRMICKGNNENPYTGEEDMDLLAKAELILALLETTREVTIANHTTWLLEGLEHLEAIPELEPIIIHAMELKTKETLEIVAQLDERIACAKLDLDLLTPAPE